MDKLFIPPISVEQFAAYLDGNLPELQLHDIDLLIATNPIMTELAEVSDIIAEDTQFYMNDDFALEADMTMLDEQDLDLPDIETISTLNMNLDIETEFEIAATSVSEDDELKEESFNEECHIGNIPENFTISDCPNNSSITTEYPTDQVDTDFELFAPNEDNFDL